MGGGGEGGGVVRAGVGLGGGGRWCGGGPGGEGGEGGVWGQFGGGGVVADPTPLSHQTRHEKELSNMKGLSAWKNAYPRL